MLKNTLSKLILCLVIIPECLGFADGRQIEVSSCLSPSDYRDGMILGDRKSKRADIEVDAEYIFKTSTGIAPTCIGNSGYFSNRNGECELTSDFNAKLDACVNFINGDPEASYLVFKLCMQNHECFAPLGYSGTIISEQCRKAQCECQKASILTPISCGHSTEKLAPESHKILEELMENGAGATLSIQLLDNRGHSVQIISTGSYDSSFFWIEIRDPEGPRTISRLTVHFDTGQVVNQERISGPKLYKNEHIFVGSTVNGYYYFKKL